MIRTLARAAAWLVLAAAGVLAALVLVYRVVDPPVTPLMLRNAYAYGIHKQWVDLAQISPALLRAVIAAEDARFLEHHGVDWDALRAAADFNAEHGGALRRGGSTITMQCARNVFLWQGKSYLRKGLEIALAHAIELAWGKRRILEVYLNVVEWGPGLYGAEAAARRHVGVSAAALDGWQAALLAAALPNPRRWTPSRPTRWLGRRAETIEQRAAGVRLGVLERGA